jgi:hypothetical protein
MNVKADNRKCVYITVVPQPFKFSLLPTDSVILDHAVPTLNSPVAGYNTTLCVGFILERKENILFKNSVK